MDAPRLEELGCGIWVQVSEAHTFGADALLLSGFSAPRGMDTACDLGCGCGAVSLRWFCDGGPKRVVAVDIQRDAVEQARVSAEVSGLTGRYCVLQADLRELPDSIGPGGFDLVVCNPPYRAAGTGRLSKTAEGKTARHETACTLGDVCAAAARLLRFGGRLCLCHLPERLPDIFEAMRDNRVEPKRIRFVQRDARSAPWLVLAEGRLGAGVSLRVEAPLLQEEGGFAADLTAGRKGDG